MNDKTSAGVVVYRHKPDRRQYLLIKSRTGDWEFPKGSVEDGEELQQTALRELEEETGIDNVRLIDGFREAYDYVFRGRKGEMIDKDVHVFIGEALDDTVTLSEEHSDLQWKDFEQAFNTLPHDGPKSVLERAHEYLDSVG